jgi:hypothetical protein
MTDAIKTGTVLMAEGTPLPESLLLGRKSYSSGWAIVSDTPSTLEQTIQEAGWRFFFVAGGITATAFGFDRGKALHTAVGRILAQTKSRNCNSVEIIRVTSTSFLKLPYVSVSAHLRHIQQGVVLHQPVALPAWTVSLSPALVRPR